MENNVNNNVEKKVKQIKNKENAKVDKSEKKVMKKTLKAEKREAKLQKQYTKVKDGSKFKKWRNRRPFWGATLTVLAGLLILYIPMHLYAIAFIPGSLVFIGFLFGGLTLILGIMAFIFPQFSTVFGVITLFLSVLSIMGALGGFLVGTIIGIIAGSLCIAWTEEEITVRDNDDKKRVTRPKLKVDNQGTNTVQL